MEFLEEIFRGRPEIFAERSLKSPGIEISSAVSHDILDFWARVLGTWGRSDPNLDDGWRSFGLGQSTECWYAGAFCWDPHERALNGIDTGIH